jgi:hypothetical protein
LESDLPIFFEHQRDPVANRMAAFPARKRDAFMEHWSKILSDPSVVVRTVLLDGAVAGNVQSFERDGAREVGYWIGRDHWGKGVATRPRRIPRRGYRPPPVCGGGHRQRGVPARRRDVRVLSHRPAQDRR